MQYLGIALVSHRGPSFFVAKLFPKAPFFSVDCDTVCKTEICLIMIFSKLKYNIILLFSIGIKYIISN